jgi:hypothetical protein
MNATGEVRFDAQMAGQELRNYYNEQVQSMPKSDQQKALRERGLDIVGNYNKRAAEKTKLGQERLKAKADADKAAAEAQREAEKLAFEQRTKTISQKSINMLRENPSLVATFEKTYGLRPGEGQAFLKGVQPDYRAIPSEPR